MAKTTDIAWTDSTVNASAGCDGCELWTGTNRTCYAGKLTAQYAGQKGWPAAFDKPTLFPERIKIACRWPDLKGTVRLDKPWIPASLPRMIFLDDMGDPFTESLPLEWLGGYLADMANSPHIWQVLTKRPRRMAAFFERVGYVPDNFWLGISVTDRRTYDARLPWLLECKARVRFVSCEPMLGQVDFRFSDSAFPGGEQAYIGDMIQWLIVGGMSGVRTPTMSINWAENAREQCGAIGVKLFIKQDSGLRPGQQGRIPDHLWCVKQFPQPRQE